VVVVGPGGAVDVVLLVDRLALVPTEDPQATVAAPLIKIAGMPWGFIGGEDTLLWRLLGRDVAPASCEASFFGWTHAAAVQHSDEWRRRGGRRSPRMTADEDGV
jgi:hypothetical protein